MRVLSVTGPSDAGKTTCIERLLDALDPGTTAATVKHLGCSVAVDEPGKDTYRHRAAGATTTYGTMDDGAWFATGAEHDLETLVRSLTADHDLLLLEGYSDAPVPTVALGGRAHRGETVATAERGADVDVDGLLDLLSSVEGVETAATLAAALADEEREPGDGEERASAAVGTLTATLPAPTTDGERPMVTRWADDEDPGDAAETAAAVAAVQDAFATADASAWALHRRPHLSERADDVFVAAVRGRRQRTARAAIGAATDRLLATAAPATFETAVRSLPA